MPNTIAADESVASRLLSVLPRLHHTLRRDRQRVEASDPATPSLSDRVGQYRLLSMLLINEPMTTYQLAERMEVSPPTVSTMIRRLAEQEMVERKRDADDQRVVWLTITGAGREVVEEERRRWRGVFLQRFEQLATEDQRLIAAAIPALERLLDADPAVCAAGEG
jgi:DNA-binding MarR family transcriptional regulator